MNSKYFEKYLALETVDVPEEELLERKINRSRIELSKAKNERDRNRLKKDLQNFNQQLDTIKIGKYYFERYH